MFFRTRIIFVIIILEFTMFLTNGTALCDEQLHTSVSAARTKRSWTKQSISKVATELSKFKSWWRVILARDVILYSTKFEKKIGNVKIYSKPGGLTQAHKDINAIGLSNVHKFHDDEGFEVVVGTVDNNAMIKLTYGDHFAKVGYPTITMYPRSTPLKSSGSIKVFYTETAPREGYGIPFKMGS